MTAEDGVVRWGILGTGKIARVLARALAESRDGTLVAVGSRDGERAKEVAGEFGAPRHHASYEGLIEDEGVDLVYVATHHPAHREWAVRAAEAGKHVLCEKPLAMRASDAAGIVEAARANEVFLLEAFAYRCHPQTAALSRLLRDGAIGEIRMVDAVFGYDAGPDPGNYLLAHELGGGGILDVGCYTTSMAHLVAAAAASASTVETVDVAAAATIGPTGVDVSSAATLVFERGLLARVACSLEANLDSSVRIYGSEGEVAIPSPWLPGSDRRHGRDRRPSPGERAGRRCRPARVRRLHGGGRRGERVRSSGGAVAVGDAGGRVAREHADARSVAEGHRRVVRG